ncbi:unnamed protein product [Mytilus edulis]|uniref:Uncharacterized protein n=1 Tax=Mytilus edulis TaxID=6550 RepID=A0A8S3PV45_MYTED|nr:unnamed protein product [Mytilus edulis]
MSSNVNTCQALVKPDCSKSGLQKSTGTKKSLDESPWYTFEDIQLQDVEEKVNSLGLLWSDIKKIQPDISKNIKFAVFEFAGVKFQAPVSSGKDYLAYVANVVVGKAMRLFPSIRHMIVCEEKYGFTPDDLKAETRAKRQKKIKYFNCSSETTRGYS